MFFKAVRKLPYHVINRMKIKCVFNYLLRLTYYEGFRGLTEYIQKNKTNRAQKQITKIKETTNLSLGH